MTLTDDQARALRAHYDRLKASGDPGLEDIKWVEEISPRELEPWERMRNALSDLGFHLESLCPSRACDVTNAFRAAADAANERTIDTKRVREVVRHVCADGNVSGIGERIIAELGIK